MKSSPPPPPRDQNLFKNITSVNLLICCKFYPLNDFVTFFQFKRIGVQILPLHKIDQGHPRVIIYTYFVELESLMLNAKFQDHRTSDS